MSNTIQADSGPRFSHTQGSCASPASKGPGNTLHSPAQGRVEPLRQAAKTDLPEDLRLRPGRPQAASQTSTVICLPSMAKAAWILSALVACRGSSMRRMTRSLTPRRRANSELLTPCLSMAR